MKLLLTLLVLSTINVFAQPNSEWRKKDTTSNSALSKKWYDNISIRGYMQVRYNRLMETNAQLKCDQCDKSIGDGGGISLRRMRLVFYGQIHKRIYLYIQPDFASSASSNSLHFGQLRDAYVDVGLDNKNEFRIRLGQSKIPFGFENMQSSQNRLPLDRGDALNSAFANERDLGAFFYWAPANKRKEFSSLVSEGFKGEGDYGIVAFGVFNGQGANKPDQNKGLHVVGRITYPFKIGDQVIEPSIQAYKGKYVLLQDQLSHGINVSKAGEYVDERIAATFVLYPKPFGIQSEFNIGRGPEFNKDTDSVEVKKLAGGYVTLNYLMKLKKQVIFPFVRLQYYSGGKKFETDARSYGINEFEWGIEWQPNKHLELVAEHVSSKRRFEDFKSQNNLQRGSFMRLQAQLNF